MGAPLPARLTLSLNHHHPPSPSPCCARPSPDLSSPPPPALLSSLHDLRSHGATTKKSSPTTRSPEMWVMEPPRPVCMYLIAVLQVGSLPKNAPDVGTGLVGAPA